MRTFICSRCGKPSQRSLKTITRFCVQCVIAHGKEGSAAINAVAWAIKSGRLPKAAKSMCVDCGKQARDYDHRDYTRPLDVQTVCRSCNQKRGPTLDSQMRALPEVAV